MKRHQTDSMIAQRLRSIRKLRNLSQADVALELCHFGIVLHPSAIAKNENAERTVSLIEASALSKVFGVPVGFLVGEDTAPSKTATTLLSEVRDRLDLLEELL